MTAYALLTFGIAYLAILVVPGPAVIAVIARVLARGPQGATFFIAGFVCGALVWLTLAATGLAAIASTFAPLFTAIRYLGAAYLFYLAWKMWTSPTTPQAIPAPADGARLFLTGLTINLGNPKAVVFFLAVLPAVMDVRALTLTGFLELAAITAATVSLVLGGYALTAARARRIMASPTTLRRMKRGSSLAMAAAGAAVALK